MGAWNPQANDIFLKATEIESLEQRLAYLSEACASDAELRAHVDSLIAARDRAGAFLESPASGLETGVAAGLAAVFDRADVALSSGSESVGTIFDRYKLLERIGEGGFGIVFLAEQQHPVRRMVALKVIKPGLDSKQVIARFEAERQALALMDHPNIAKVHDAGATETGRPYFVMELVQGIPITDYCDRNHLPPRERLELFIDVCRAVQHAHTKGITHRDIKPSNVLVMLHDGKAVPKVIDFGVAKATGPQLTDQTLVTHFAQMVGTPLYMSPEQAEMGEIDVDTRSDVYSLGVLLYELLTGTTPVEKDRLKQAALDEMRRIIREEEQPKPSTRISALQGKLATDVSSSRRTDPRQLGQIVRGDLDWIVMKCLEKDRARRYETANGLAADVSRYMADEPVLARPPTAAYRFRKLARRHRAALTTAAAIAVILAVATVASILLAVRARHAEKLAKTRFDTEAAARIEAERAKTEAKSESAIAHAVLQFIEFDLLAQGNPFVQPDRELTLRAVIDRASDRVEEGFKGQPEVEAAIRYTLATTYQSMGEFAKAEKHLLRALELRRTHSGENHPYTLECSELLATVYNDQRRYAESENLHRHVLEAYQRMGGEDSRFTLSAKSDLAGTIANQGRLAEAEGLFKDVLKAQNRVLGEEDPNTLHTTANLAIVYAKGQRYGEAQLLQRKVLESLRRVRGDQHPSTIQAMSVLAATLSKTGNDEEAIHLLDQALAASRKVLGEEHPNTLFTLSYKVQSLGISEQGRRLGEQLLALERQVYGDDDPKTRQMVQYLSWLNWKSAWGLLAHARAGEPECVEGMVLAQRALELEPQSPMTLQIMGWAEYRNGNFKAAVEKLERSCALSKDRADPLQWLFMAMANWQLHNEELAAAWYTLSCEWGEGDGTMQRLRAEARELLDLPIQWPPVDWNPSEADLSVHSRAAEWNPRSPLAGRAWLLRVAALRKHQQVNEAVASALVLAERLSTPAGITGGRCAYYAALADWDEVFQKVATARAGDPDLWLERGRIIAQRLGDDYADPVRRREHQAEMARCCETASAILHKKQAQAATGPQSRPALSELAALAEPLRLLETVVKETKEPSGPFGGAPSILPGVVQAEAFDRGGLGASYYDKSLEARGNGAHYRPTSVDLDVCADKGGGFNIGNAHPGEWLAYTVDVSADGRFDLHLRASSIAAGGKLHVEFEGQDVSGSIEIPNTVTWGNWTTVTKQGIQLRKGRQVMRLVFDSVANPMARETGEHVCNLNWIAVTREGDAPPN